MLRATSALLAILPLAAAFWLYAVTFDTRRLEAEVSMREREAERLASEIAVLQAERAHLARPERIEPVARELGLAPRALGSERDSRTAGTSR